MGLFLAGVISNQGEELLFGHATDFLWVRLIGLGGLTAVVNFADLMIFSGVLLLLGALMHRLLKKKRARPGSSWGGTQAGSANCP